MTLDEIASSMGVGRRTAERMRDAVRDAFPQMEEIEDPPTKRFKIPSGLDGIFQAPTADEFAALHAAAEQFRAMGATGRAAALLNRGMTCFPKVRMDSLTRSLEGAPACMWMISWSTPTST